MAQGILCLILTTIFYAVLLMGMGQLLYSNWMQQLELCSEIGSPADACPVLDCPALEPTFVTVAGTCGATATAGSTSSTFVSPVYSHVDVTAVPGTTPTVIPSVIVTSCEVETVFTTLAEATVTTTLARTLRPVTETVTVTQDPHDRSYGRPEYDFTHYPGT